MRDEQIRKLLDDEEKQGNLVLFLLPNGARVSYNPEQKLLQAYSSGRVKNPKLHGCTKDETAFELADMYKERYSAWLINKKKRKEEETERTREFLRGLQVGDIFYQESPEEFLYRFYQLTHIEGTKLYFQQIPSTMDPRCKEPYTYRITPEADYFYEYGVIINVRSYNIKYKKRYLHKYNKEKVLLRDEQGGLHEE